MSDIIQPQTIVDTSESQRAAAAATESYRTAATAEGDAFERARQENEALFAKQQAEERLAFETRAANEARYFNEQVLPRADLNNDGQTTQAEFAEMQRREAMAPLAAASALAGALFVAEAVPAVAGAIAEGPALGFNALGASPMAMEAAPLALEAAPLALAEVGPSVSFGSLAAPAMLGTGLAFIAPQPANEPVAEPEPVQQVVGNEMPAVAAPVVRRPAAPMPMMEPPKPSWAKTT